MVLADVLPGAQAFDQQVGSIDQCGVDLLNCSRRVSGRHRIPHHQHLAGEGLTGDDASALASVMAWWGLGRSA